jgi:hypothetical protein
MTEEKNASAEAGSQASRAMPKGFDWRAFTPEDSPKTPLDVMADPRHRDLATAKLSAGDRAFDFERPLFDFSSGVRKETGRSFHLLEAAARRPVALIFGSYT